MSPEELAALEDALDRAEIDLNPNPAGSHTPWSRIAALEAVNTRVATPAGYARSPLSTPGATRA